MILFIRNVFALLSKKEKNRLYFQFACILTLTFIDILGIASILPFMAVVGSPAVIQTNPLLKQLYDLMGFTNPKSFLFFLGIIMLGLLVFSNLLKAFSAWLKLKYDNELYCALSNRLLASYLSRSYQFFLNRNTAEMGKNVLAEVSKVIGGIISPSMQAFSSGLISLFIISLLMIVNPLIAISIAVVLGGSYGLIYWVVRLRLLQIGQSQLEANTMKFKVSSEALAGIKDLKILGREWVFLERFAFYAQRHSRSNVTFGIISEIPRYALEIIAFGGILLILLLSLESDQNVSEVIPLLSLYAFAGYRLLPNLQQLFSNISTARYNLPALEILYEDLHVEKAATETDITLTNFRLPLQPLSFTHELFLKDVYFSYFGAQEPVIKGINLTIIPKTSIGFVGPTGSGKTTIVDLILGLLGPTSGQLLVDGVEINTSNLARWQHNLGYVPQHIYLCDDTITRNIAFGVSEHEIDMQAVIRAAHIANLHTFIETELPKGYETVVGERGIRLSGGQRQRIGIARALYRDPPVLIMDEATNALDGITEEAVMEALHTLSGQKTIIMIAHRFTTVKDCNLIYLMDQGRIVNQGNYRELLESSRWFQTAAKIGI